MGKLKSKKRGKCQNRKKMGGKNGWGKRCGGEGYGRSYNELAK